MAGPVEFGLAQYNAALDARNLKIRIKYDVSLEPAESFRIEPYAAGGAHISGGDLRGLMYALLEAADQIRATGRMKQTHSVPSIADSRDSHDLRETTWPTGSRTLKCWLAIASIDSR